MKKKKPSKKNIKLDFGDIYPYSAKISLDIPHNPNHSSLNIMEVRDMMVADIANRMVALTKASFLNYAFIARYNDEVYICNENGLNEKGEENVTKRLKEALFFHKRIFFQTQSDLNAFLLIFHEHFTVG